MTDLEQLLVKVAEIGADVKHLLARHGETNQRIDRIEKRNNTVNDEFDTRLRAVEGMRGRLLGIAFVLPIVVSILIFIAGRFYG